MFLSFGSFTENLHIRECSELKFEMLLLFDVPIVDSLNLSLCAVVNGECRIIKLLNLKCIFFFWLKFYNYVNVFICTISHKHSLWSNRGGNLCAYMLTGFSAHTHSCSSKPAAATCCSFTISVNWKYGRSTRLKPASLSEICPG